jgi:hypothetical protein
MFESVKPEKNQRNAFGILLVLIAWPIIGAMIGGVALGLPFSIYVEMYTTPDTNGGAAIAMISAGLLGAAIGFISGVVMAIRELMNY